MTTPNVQIFSNHLIVFDALWYWFIGKEELNFLELCNISIFDECILILKYSRSINSLDSLCSKDKLNRQGMKLVTWYVLIKHLSWIECSMFQTKKTVYFYVHLWWKLACRKLDFSAWYFISQKPIYIWYTYNLRIFFVTSKYFKSW